MALLLHTFCDMKKSFLWIGLLMGLVACVPETKDNTPTVSSDARVKGMSLAANDSFPALAKAVFLVEDRLDTGMIYNPDSLPFGTRVDSVVPSFTFYSRPGAALLYLPNADEPLVLGGHDTVDFSQGDALLEVTASDYKAKKCYQIKVNVHSVDPDLYEWEQCTAQIYAPVSAEQKAFFLRDKFYLFVNDGLQVRLYESADGYAWAPATITGLPQLCPVRSFVKATNFTQGEDFLYYCEGSNLWYSSDAKVWETKTLPTAEYDFITLLFDFNLRLWALTQNKADQTYHLASSQDGQNWEFYEALPANFPVWGYATCSFHSVSGRERAMIVGGFTASGEALNTRWNFEYSPSEGYRWTNFSIEQPNFQTLTDVALIEYNHRFFLFGDIQADGQTYAMLESTDEGMNWSVPDPVHNALPASYSIRSRQSVFVDRHNYIYLIGGQSRTAFFTDVYRGKLNSIDW